MVVDHQQALTTHWKERLNYALEGAIFSIKASKGELLRPMDGRTSVEFLEKGGNLIRARISMVLPEAQDDIGILKIGCMTLLFLTALFPHWRGIEKWVLESIGKTVNTRQPVRQALENHEIRCSFEPENRRVVFLVMRLQEAGFPV